MPDSACRVNLMPMLAAASPELPARNRSALTTMAAVRRGPWSDPHVVKALSREPFEILRIATCTVEDPELAEERRDRVGESKTGKGEDAGHRGTSVISVSMA